MFQPKPGSLSHPKPSSEAIASEARSIEERLARFADAPMADVRATSPKQLGVGQLFGCVVVISMLAGGVTILGLVFAVTFFVRFSDLAVIFYGTLAGAGLVYLGTASLLTRWWVPAGQRLRVGIATLMVACTPSVISFLVEL